MKLHFYGGAQSVTGSNYLLEAGGLRILVDCGLFQGTRFNEQLNYEPFEYDPSDIDYVVVTHGHADHIGRIPKLYRDGFRGTIIATEPTAALMPIALEDTLERMSEEARQMGHVQLYNRTHVRESMALVQPQQYRKPIDLHHRISLTLHEASHILGSAILEFVIGEPRKSVRMVFTGDLGNPPTPLLNPIDYVRDADYAIIESAYGNRLHEDRQERRTILQRVITETVERGGVLMVPSFAVERIQELLLEIDELVDKKSIPHVPVFVDSPLAIRMTEAYNRFPQYFNAHATELLKDNGGLFRFPWLTYTRTVDASKSINDLRGSKIIIAGSGMSQGGRILFHEQRYLPHPENTILFIGYQVEGCLGRRIFDGASSVSILGKHIPVRARVEAIGGYSAHADQKGLLQFVARANEGRGLKQVFVVQGEPDAAESMAETIANQLRISATVPHRGSTIAI